MKLIFTNHANYRIFYERCISIDDIKKVIKKPDRSEYIQEGLIKSRKLLSKGILVVVYSKSRIGEYIIITAYYK